MFKKGIDMDKIIPVTVVDKNREIKDIGIKINAKKSPVIATPEYHPTHIIGSCSICTMVGTLEFPQGFSYNVGDRVMDRKKVKCWCLKCLDYTEFVPLVIDGVKTDEGRAYLKRLEDNLQSVLKGVNDNGNK